MKNLAETSPNFDLARKQCAEILAEEYQNYLKKLKDRIANLKKGSKQWRRLNRELLDKKTKCSSIPPLRDGDMWINDSKGKANLFAKTFLEKSKLPEEYVDCIYVGRPDFEFDDIIPL